MSLLILPLAIFSVFQAEKIIKGTRFPDVEAIKTVETAELRVIPGEDFHGSDESRSAYDRKETTSKGDLSGSS